MSRYRFIQREKAVYPITLLCRVLGIARSAYYAWARRGVSARARADAELAAQIAAAHAQSRGTYGAPRVHAVLRAAGVRTSRRRVARLMRAGGLVGCHRRRRTRTTVADPTRLPAPNLVARDFAAPVPNRLWLGEIVCMQDAAGEPRLSAPVLDGCANEGGKRGPPGPCARSPGEPGGHALEVERGADQQVVEFRLRQPDISGTP